MQRWSAGGATMALFGAAACSVVNAPDDVRLGAGGAHASSTASSASGGTGGAASAGGAGGSGGTGGAVSAGGAGGSGGTGGIGGSGGTGGSGGAGGVVSSGGTGGISGSGGAGGVVSSGGTGGGGGAGGAGGDACGGPCSLPNAASVCVDGQCKVGLCSVHYDNCDGVDANGCEVSLLTDPIHCGACGVACAAFGGTASCVSGQCQFACNVGRGNCDSVDANGCETDLTTSATHCGACGVVCSDGTVCSESKCVPPSCGWGATGQADCGPGHDESCCATLAVPGGTVQLDGTHTAMVSSFRLDKYEITVGRFRKFVDAWTGGWRPAAGAGKHTHLNGGNGLSDGQGNYEPGWDPALSGLIPATKPEWDLSLACEPGVHTWTSASGEHERRPLTCAAWFEQYAFCTWDGGFLPSEAEWQYAAAGGSEGRPYPWGPAQPGPNTDLAVYGCYWGDPSACPSVVNIAPVGSAPGGNGRWGHSDLAGNVWEWTLDSNGTRPLTVVDFAFVTFSYGNRMVHGGDFHADASDLLTTLRAEIDVWSRYSFVGARCARSP